MKLAVLGSPIAHSKSPLLHRAAYRELGLAWDYQAHEVDTHSFDAFLAQLTPEWRGLSLTMPLKECVVPHLAERDTFAVLSESTNTVAIDWGANGPILSGYNTDIAGILAALADSGITSASNVVIVGAGATARSALVAAAELGAHHVEVVARTPSKAHALIALGLKTGVSVNVTTLDSSGVDALSSETDLVMSTLPAQVGAAELFRDSPLRNTSALFDVAYSPWPSDFAQVWGDSPTVSGLSMLVHQAVRQIRIFVSGDPFAPLENESRVRASMFAAVAE